MITETSPLALILVVLAGRWMFTGYIIVDMAGDFMERRRPLAYARLRMLRAWWTWPFVFIAAPITIASDARAMLTGPFVFIAAPITIASDARAMLTGPSFMRVLIVPVDVWIVWYAWTHRDDDDPWKRAGKRIGERVAQVGHRLVIVPIGGRQ
jgi:hypothetical protein